MSHTPPPLFRHDPELPLPTHENGGLPIGEKLASDTEAYRPELRGRMTAGAHRGSSSGLWWIKVSMGVNGPTYYRPLSEGIELRNQLVRGLKLLAEQMEQDPSRFQQEDILLLPKLKFTGEER